MEITKKHIGIGFVVIILIVLFIWKPWKKNYSELANCLKNNGTKFYGASWCPKCKQQKEWFGRGADLLPYIECLNPDRSLNQVCADAEIRAYPTWIFPDGTRKTGAIPVDALKQFAGC